MNYALDSNIISFLLKDNDAVYSRYFDTVSQGDTCVIPLVVYYEVLRGLLANDAKKKMSSFEDLCAVLGIIDLTVADMTTAATIYTTHKSSGTLIEDTDILIAAQCVTRGYTLVTNNTRHFDRVNGLQLVDWVE